MGLKRFVSDAEEEGLVDGDWREVPERHGGFPTIFWLLFLGGCAAILLIGMSVLTVGVIP